jgi:predicted anti-sigma-YlaC factor YlaD
MNCKKFSRLLSVRQDGELAPDLEQEVKFHLQGCPACRGEWDALQALLGTLKSLPPPALDPFLPEKVMSGLRAQPARKSRFLPLFAYALVFLTIFLGSFLLQMSSNNTVAAESPLEATFTAVLLENQDLGLLAVHDNTLGLFER